MVWNLEIILEDYLFALHNFFFYFYFVQYKLSTHRKILLREMLTHENGEQYRVIVSEEEPRSKNINIEVCHEKIDKFNNIYL